MKNSILKLNNVKSLNSSELKEIKGGDGTHPVQIIEHYCCLSPNDPRAANQQGSQFNGCPRGTLNYPTAC
jgi:hypothetical protein